MEIPPLPPHRLPPYVTYDYVVYNEGGIIQCGRCGHASNRLEYLQHHPDCPARKVADVGESG